MSKDFHLLATAVLANVNSFVNQAGRYVLCVNTSEDSDVLWNNYLNTFKPEDNPIFLVNTEHDGSYDRNFIRRIGGLVHISKDNEVSTIWGNADHLPSPYNYVAAHMDKTVKELVQANGLKPFFVKRTESLLGHAPNIRELPNGKLIEFPHFYYKAERKLLVDSVGEAISEPMSIVTSFKRSLETISDTALNDILELALDKNFYRSEQYLPSLQGYKTIRDKYLAAPLGTCDLLIWNLINKQTNATSLCIASTAIGELLKSYTKSGDLENEVRKFESMVAPSNYSRPKAIISSRQRDEFIKQIDEKGCRDSLNFRLATTSDLDVNDVLWTNAASRSLMHNDPLKALLDTGVKTSKPVTSNEVTIEDFISQVLPGVTKLEAFVENQHKGNFMSITSQVDPDSPSLFSWGNQFGWSYKGNVTDSIKERVKAAGGNTEAYFRVSLAWHSESKIDLDLHCNAPFGHIYFARNSRFGILDVDMNGLDHSAVDAVENMAFSRSNLENGVYSFYVDNYSIEPQQGGFTLEVEYAGKITQYHYNTTVRGKERVNCLNVKVVKGIPDVIANNSLSHEAKSELVYGINTQSWVEVGTAMLSPNYWGTSASGNKHYMFLLKDAKADEPVRALFNEYLRGDLKPIRRAFEVIGGNLTCAAQDNELSGLGFSSTIRNEIKMRVHVGDKSRVYTVKF